MTNETKELAKTETNELALAQEMNDMDWGVAPEARNIVIPKAMLMQGLSDLVSDGKAKLGDIVNSINGEVLGGIDKPVILVPFYIAELWYIFKVTGAGETEFDRVETMNADNANWSYEGDENGHPIKRTKIMQVYCLDPKNTALPIVVSFKGTSYKAGKELYTMMYFTNRQEKKFPPSYMINLSSVKDKNDKGTFAKFTFSKGDTTSIELIRESAKWVKTITSGQAKTDESELKPSKDKEQPEQF